MLSKARGAHQISKDLKRRAKIRPRKLASVQQLQPPSLPPTPHALTRRESEVLSRVAHGKTSADIGLILGISRRTVEKFLERAYLKLGVETRTAAAMKMVDVLKIPRTN